MFDTHILVANTLIKYQRERKSFGTGYQSFICTEIVCICDHNIKRNHIMKKAIDSMYEHLTI